MLTIGELAAYAGVTTRAVRHYHHVGLLPEPERDASGYRRYGAGDAVALIRIRTLADAGVPLSRVAELLDAGPVAFRAELQRIDEQLQQEIERLQATRGRIADLGAGDPTGLPSEVTQYLDGLRDLGVTGPVLEGERDGWILVTARWPERVPQWMPAKMASLQDPEMVRMYRLMTQVFEDESDAEDLLEELADLMTSILDKHEAEAVDEPGRDPGDVAHDLLEGLALEADPRSERLMELMRRRGWNGWSRTERVAG
ncbi:MerR family transcriptional regulator [Citricoccus sp. GCM10030269]|uniref:MerR family transcriptional regulator n=1 Tax=Citricoccus sp. GCM10030269 TaxID=3273388 RepID=UPI00360779BA